MAIDPTMAVRGGEWSVNLGDGGIPAGSPAGAGAAKGGGFGGMLADQIGALEKLQTNAAQGSQALAAGNADPTAVVMAVEKARLGMQLASQIRTKAVEAVQDIFHTQV
ncbi:MAG: flagellar hook-basal body complex protein FliE [Solirubrobacteraceae bacterium]|jgi:flagellar hook-basal body complex protein FliE|nr:flagellar hook-basal body complex protein FliE [Solirubrobacteraceae bacterium]